MFDAFQLDHWSSSGGGLGAVEAVDASRRVTDQAFWAVAVASAGDLAGLHADVVGGSTSIAWRAITVIAAGVSDGLGGHGGDTKRAALGALLAAEPGFAVARRALG